MAFPIIGILIHDELDIAMVCVNQCITLHNVQTIDLVLVNACNSAFSGRLRILTSEPARPPLAPLSTSESCWTLLPLQHDKVDGYGLSWWTTGVYHLGL